MAPSLHSPLIKSNVMYDLSSVHLLMLHHFFYMLKVLNTLMFFCKLTIPFSCNCLLNINVVVKITGTGPLDSPVVTAGSPNTEDTVLLQWSQVRLPASDSLLCASPSLAVLISSLLTVNEGHYSQKYH